MLDEATKTALGSPLSYLSLVAFGDGILNDTDAEGTQSELKSDTVYVGTLGNSTVAFEQGFDSGYTPTNGSAVAILQYLAASGEENNATFLWDVDTSFVPTPASLQLRYFVDLTYQPVVAELTPRKPGWPATEGEPEENAVFSGSKLPRCTCIFKQCIALHALATPASVLTPSCFSLRRVPGTRNHH